MQVITIKKLDVVKVFSGHITGAKARFLGFGIAVILLSMLWNSSVRADNLELRLGSNTTVGNIYISGSGKKQYSKSFLTALGRIYIKNKKIQGGFAPACATGANKVITKPYSHISNHNGQKVYFVVLLEPNSDLNF